MSVLETVLVFVVIPVGLYGIVAALAVGPRITRRRRYRPGQRWPYDPVWWMEEPADAVAADAGSAAGQLELGASTTAPSASTVFGGARGNW